MTESAYPLGKFTLKCPACGGTQFSAAEDIQINPESPMTCGNCGHTTTKSVLVKHNEEAALESVKERAAKVALEAARKVFDKKGR